MSIGRITPVFVLSDSGLALQIFSTCTCPGAMPLPGVARVTVRLPRATHDTSRLGSTSQIHISEQEYLSLQWLPRLVLRGRRTDYLGIFEQNYGKYIFDRSRKTSANIHQMTT